MPEQAKVAVTNTTPLIALTAATGNLDVLRAPYTHGTRVIVPYEVAEEIRAGGEEAFGLDVFQQASWLEINPTPVVLPPYMQNTLDRGEASVIQTALQQGVKRVCIDETAGRRVARLPSNITEGYERNSDKELANCLNYAKGSADELRTQMYMAKWLL